MINSLDNNLEASSGKKINIAIDGPAGAGKSTIAKIISKKLGYIYLDTGAMYRSFALFAIQNGVDTLDHEALKDLLKDFNLEIKYSDGGQHVILNGVNVTDKIRTVEVSEGSSNVAVVPEVRFKMVDLQRDIARNNNVVMDGRDIGTYVLPDADVKIFLTASVEERAHRRYLELKEKGMSDISLDKIKEDIIYRDKNDSEREFAPLRKAEDAIEIDTTALSVGEVVDKIINLVVNN